MTAFNGVFGDTFADVFFNPLDNPIEPPVTCFATLYDAVDDYFSSTEAAFKFAGDFTVGVEVNLKGLAAGDTWLSNERYSKGFHIKAGTSGELEAYVFGNSSTFSNPISAAGVIPLNTWVKCLLTSGINTPAKLYADDVLVATGAVLVSGLRAASEDFHIGTSAASTSRVTDGYLRNITICTGVTSTPTAWDPEDPSSLIGCAQVMYSAKGNDENTQALAFTKFGDPITGPCV